VDAFTWDCDGMGVGLSRQVGNAFNGTRVSTTMFKGSEGVDHPAQVYDPQEGQPIQDRKTWADVARNKRAQYYLKLRDRCFKTFRAVQCGEYANPEELISFSSTIGSLYKLRSELCRMPIKPNGNGKLELYTKDVMKTKFKQSSPNLADSVMMLMREPQILAATPVIPQPLRPIGRR
jgi:phage terminase large subunit